MMEGISEINFSSPLRVLIVEDNQIDLKILESMLQDLDTVALLKAVSSYDKAIAELSSNQFDVIILDLNLPDSEGSVTIQQISKSFPEIAIVVNTGAYEAEQGLQALKYGAQDFLVKGKYTNYILNKVMYYAMERKRLEIELKSTYEKLKNTQSQLIESEKMKVVGGLASGVAHEVRNPLSTILYGVTFLDENLKIQDEQIQTVLTNIKEATSRANEIITDLLDFASLSNLNRKPCSLNDIVDKALFLVNHEISKKNVTIVKKYDKKLPLVNVDKNRIEQVIINLLLNALHSVTEKGDVVISTSTKKVTADLLDSPKLNRNNFAENDLIAVCEIEDSGTGIQADKIDQVFDPFFTTRRAKGGVGLGLSVCKNIVNNHNGSIFIENKKKNGAKATLIFKVEE